MKIKHDEALAAYAQNLNLELSNFGSWDESLVLGDGATVRDSTNGLPVIDGADLVSSWADTAYTNVYSASITHDGYGSERLRVYENGALMTRVLTVQECSTTPGSFVHMRSSMGSPVTAYIHPSGSVSPSASYEVTVRRLGVTVGDDALINGLRVQRCLDNNGALKVGRNASISRVVSVDGSKHNVLIGSGSLTDVIAVRCDPITADEPSQTYFVGYTPNPSGQSITMTRCGAVAGLGGSRRGIAHIMHGEGSVLYDAFNAEQIWAVDCSYGYEPSADTITINGIFGSNVNNITAPWGRVVTIEHAVLKQGNGRSQGIVFNPTSAGAIFRVKNSIFYDEGSNFSLIRPASANGCTLEFENCIFYSHGFRSLWDVTGWTSGILKIRNCIFVLASNGIPLTVPAGVSYVGQSNVFVCNTNGGTNLNLSYAGTSYDTMPTWRAVTGQDVDSLAFGPSDLPFIFSGDVHGGDFTIRNLNAGALVLDLLAGPATSWDWNGRKTVIGSPKAWPRVPATLADCEQYVVNPTAWVF